MIITCGITAASTHRSAGGSQGWLIALAQGLRARPQLQTLWLSDNYIGDDGVAALVAPGEAVLPSLK